jgi:hypothetical protein
VKPLQASKALRMIADGFAMLAEAMDELDTSAQSSASKGASAPIAPKPEAEAPPANEDDEPFPAGEEETPAPAEGGEVTLEDIQRAGKDLLAKGRRDVLKSVLAEFKLPNLSSAKPKQYQKLWDALNK